MKTLLRIRYFAPKDIRVGEKFEICKDLVFQVEEIKETTETEAVVFGTFCFDLFSSLTREGDD